MVAASPFQSVVEIASGVLTILTCVLLIAAIICALLVLVLAVFYSRLDRR